MIDLNSSSSPSLPTSQQRKRLTSESDQEGGRISSQGKGQGIKEPMRREMFNIKREDSLWKRNLSSNRKVDENNKLQQFFSILPQKGEMNDIIRQTWVQLKQKRCFLETIYF